MAQSPINNEQMLDLIGDIRGKRPQRIQFSRYPQSMAGYLEDDNTIFHFSISGNNYEESETLLRQMPVLPPSTVFYNLIDEIAQRARQCPKGKPCGETCISNNKNCRKGLSGPASKASKEVAKSAPKKRKGGGGAGGGGEPVPEAAQPVRALLALPPAGGSSARPEIQNGPPLTPKEIKQAVLDRFGAKDLEDLKNNGRFRMATNNSQENFRSPERMKQLYRDWVGVLPDERFSTGPTAINGVDVLKYNRPYQVFGLDPNSSTYKVPKGLKGKARREAEDAAAARLRADVKRQYLALAKKYHPDVGGDARVFARLTRNYESLTTIF